LNLKCYSFTKRSSSSAKRHATFMVLGRPEITRVLSGSRLGVLPAALAKGKYN